MSDYRLEGNNFIIENYNQQKTFANFLPGVAGKMGIPLWVFYVNRGQGIAGYGLQDKNHPIMAFTPANKAYETAPITGFRTFIKVEGHVYEPFATDGNYPNRMVVEQDAFQIEETNNDLQLHVSVTTHGLVNEPLAGLVRHVKITNTGDVAKTFEIVDGIAEILPAGIQNDAFKAVSNVLASWIDVEHLDQRMAYYTLRASTDDTSEINGVDAGNFYLGMVDGNLVTPIVDQSLIFGYNTAKTSAANFEQTPLSDLIAAKQVTTNKLPCGFLPAIKKLAPGETLHIHALSGHASDIDVLRKAVPRLMCPVVFERKRHESKTIIDALLEDVKTDTGDARFNAYVKQNYLDNFLRGGYPEKIGNTIYHLYSRRHGDLERDYNFFSLAPEYYSQGAGNFRDVCQNRRLDTVIHPKVADFNIHLFASLIQLDGYNPLSVNGVKFTLESLSLDAKEALISNHFRTRHSDIMKILDKPFTPGTLVNAIEREKIDVITSTESYLEAIFAHATPFIDAAFGEGFWTDHFTYVIDLVESYDAIYPDKIHDLLYKEEKYSYFDAPVSVLPKSMKTVLNREGNVRQYNSLRHFDKEKLERFKRVPHQAAWSTIDGETYRSNLATKLLVLTLTKHSLLDPEGLGVEMEAEKPGWNDAMNGLPGLFGSGLSETIELWRIVRFLLEKMNNTSFKLPTEIATLFKAMKKNNSYNARLNARHRYREAIRFGLKGTYDSVDASDVHDYLESLKTHIERRVTDLVDEHEGILPTFLYYDVTDHDVIEGETSPKGYALVKPKHYERHALPAFLEAPARLLKTDYNQESLKRLHEKIKESDIYDKTLKMFKTSECLDGENHEIGRIRAFTKGWLERESNFLHMNYKYLLGLLKAGLYEEFYESIETNLVCFMDPERYGRSPLENSSFIAPTNNPDSSTHGQGFYARLSGSTVETLNMWTVMMTGGTPFQLEKGKLTLRFAPKLHRRFFKEDGTLTFRFLGTTDVTYINETRENTYDRSDIHKIELDDGRSTTTIYDSCLRGTTANDVRQGIYKTLKIYMNKKGG